MGEPPRERPRPAAPVTTRASRREVRLEDLSDAELEAEIERRRLDRELEDRARAASARRPAPRAAPGARAPPRARPRGAPGPGDPRSAKAYAALEVPPGSDFETVRKAYRT